MNREPTTIPPAGPISHDVPGTVSNLQQPTSNTCWAATATILLRWKENLPHSFADVVKRAGPQFEAKFNANKGLLGSEKPGLLTALGLNAEAPQNFTVKGWHSLLKSHGLLWVTSNEGTAQDFAVHARILKGIFGDETPDGTFFKIVDPATGTDTTETVAEFIKKFESVAQGDLGSGADLRPQVVHF